MLTREIHVVLVSKRKKKKKDYNERQISGVAPLPTGKRMHGFDRRTNFLAVIQCNGYQFKISMGR